MVGNIGSGELIASSFHHVLNNGLQVVLRPQHQLHTLGVGLYVGVGSRYELPELVGISHFLEHVLFRGNASYPTSLEMNRAFESWGGTFNGSTGKESSSYFGMLHPDYLQEAVKFMADFCREPTFADVALERAIILEERLEDVDEDGQLLELDEIAHAAHWGSHPLGHCIIGNPTTLKKIGKSALERHFQIHYGMKNCVLVLTGEFDPEVAKTCIQAAFADLPSGQRGLPQPAPESNEPTRFTSVVHCDDSQIELQLSFSGPPPTEDSFYPFLILKGILDDGMSSRLWHRIVEEKGLCYDVWCDIEEYRDISLLSVGGSIAAEKGSQLLEEILKLLIGPNAEKTQRPGCKISCQHDSNCSISTRAIFWPISSRLMVLLFKHCIPRKSLYSST